MLWLILFTAYFDDGVDTEYAYYQLFVGVVMILRRLASPILRRNMENKVPLR